MPRSSPPETKEVADTPLLEISKLTVSFSGMRAVNELDLEVRTGTRAAVIGPNGAGKSTLLKAVMGETAVLAGSIRWSGRDVSSSAPFQRARFGFIRTRQELGLFWSMTAWENIICGADNPGARRPQKGAKGAAAVRDYAEQVITWLDLDTWRNMVPSMLPYGVRKRVELARALAARPRLLMLDEPVAGLNTAEKAEMVQLLQGLLPRLDVTLILVEHDMDTVAALCPEQVEAMVAGRIVCSGKFTDVIKNPVVVAAYFGSKASDTAAVHPGPDASSPSAAGP